MSRERVWQAELAEDEGYIRMMTVVARQKSLKERRGRRNGKKGIFLFDLRRGASCVFEFSQKGIRKKAAGNDFTPPPNLDGVLLVIGAGKRRELTLALKDLLPLLSARTPVFVFEERKRKLADRDLKKRLGVLKAAGLVERSILTGEPWLVWRARTAAERRTGKTVNLIEEGPKWRQEWVKKLLREIAAKYWKAGFEVLDASEIIGMLRETRFPHDTLGRLKLGFGVRLAAPCGCQWEVDLNGDWSRVLDCGDPGCDGLPHLSGKMRPLKKERRRVFCADCGGEMHWVPGMGVYVCPHCGVD